MVYKQECYQVNFLTVKKGSLCIFQYILPKTTAFAQWFIFCTYVDYGYSRRNIFLQSALPGLAFIFCREGYSLTPAFLQTKHSFCLLLMYAACFNFEVHLVSSRKTRTCNFSLINFAIFSIFTILTKLGYMQDFLSVGCNSI